MEHEIHAATSALIGALARGDVAEAGELYSDDARLLTPSAELIQGRSEIEAYWRAGIELGLAALAFKSWIVETVPGGALEVGRYEVSLRDARADSATRRGAYLVLHTRAADGAWRRAVEAFNPGEPYAARAIQRSER